MSLLHLHWVKSVGIDQAWDGLHFLLTGLSLTDTVPSPPPLGNVVQGGTPTEWEATFGTVRYLTPQEVKAVSFALDQITEADLRTRYSPKTFRRAGIYPGGEVWDESGIEYLLEVFSKVRDFYSAAAREGDVVLLSFD